MKSLSSTFRRCVKSVKKTVRARKGSNKESAAIAICTKSVLQKRGRTMKRYSRKRLITQKKFLGGATTSRWKSYSDRAARANPSDLVRIAQDMQSDTLISTPSSIDEEYVDGLFVMALKKGSRPLIQALYQKGISKEFMLRNIDTLVSEDIPEDVKSTLHDLRSFVANLS